jgi:hypothetical protein
MMSKAALRQWPWNNMPSKRHVWTVAHQNVDHCDRCGANFHRVIDARGPVYCYPTPQWLVGHPQDDGKQG